MMDDHTISDNIKLFRLRKGLVHTDITEALHFTRQSYSKLESGKVRIVNPRIYRLAEFYGVEPEELLLGYSPDPEATGHLQETKRGYDVKYKRLQREFEGVLENKASELKTLRDLVNTLQKTIQTQEEIIQMLKSRIPEENA